MTGWIPSSIQKRLLRYALNKSGLLDVTGIDLDNLDISWGRKTALEFKNVNLNVEYLATLAKLPPNLRVESARILLLRLIIPADILNSGILFEVDGVDVVAKLAEEEDLQTETAKESERTSRDTQSPSHRKTTRRIQTPPLRRYGESRLPTTEDLAKSFLAEEPPEERRELEASAAVNTKSMDESIISESSDGSDIGTGAAPGLPGFLSAWLQRLVDRFELKIHAVRVSLEIETSDNSPEDGPVNVIARLGHVFLPPGSDVTKKRELQFDSFSIELVASQQTLSDLSHITTPASPAASRATRSSHHSDFMLNQSLDDFSQMYSGDQIHERMSVSDGSSSAGRTGPLRDEPDASLMLESHNNDVPAADTTRNSVDDLGIQMGDDNISWTSRRSRGDEPTDDIWDQPAEDNLPESLILGMNLPLPQSRTSAASSSPSRSRRATSPYDRGMQGPGSWPRLDESPQSSRSHIVTGSWPAVDQSQADIFQSLTSDAAEDPADPTDNKRHALEASFHEARLLPSPKLPTSEDDAAGLEESRYFSHEEAESMYVSAIGSVRADHMPGAWQTDSTSQAQFDSPDLQNPAIAGLSDTENETDTAPKSPALAELTRHPSNAHSESATPRGHTPSPPTPKPHEPSLPDAVAQTTLQLLHVDALTVVLPSSFEDNVVSSPTPHPSPSAFTNNAASSLAMSRVGMPGAFSTYSQLSSSQRRGAASVMAERETSSSAPPTSVRLEKAASGIEVRFGKVKLQANVSTAKLVHHVSNTFKVTSKGNEARSANEEKAPANTALAIHVGSLDIEFREELEVRLDQVVAGQSPALFCLATQNIRISSSPAQHSIRVGTLTFAVGEHTLLAFDQKAQALSESMVFDEDLRITVDTSKYTNVGRPISSVGIETRPVRIDINLDIFDDIFSSFGGLSGILDIGNSIALEASPSTSPIVPDRQQRVRFEDDAITSDASTEYKVNASIAGLSLALSAERTAVALQSGSFKGVYREQAASVRFSSTLRLSGPYLGDSNTAPARVDFTGLWIHFLFTPQEQDLERLLSLITPSKDKYDNDDDILLETLLRQRRKGSCLRLTVEDTRIKIDDLDSLENLQTLNKQVARLSAVTKYLPEDERPGLLSLIRIKNVDFRVPVNDRFGILQVVFKELQLAHVGLPALLALSLSDVVVAQMNGPELLHALIPLSGPDNLPMIMARMLDDEVEPVVKVKLYNVCAEYSVQTLLDLTGTDPNADVEDIVTDLASSIADLAKTSTDNHQAQIQNPEMVKRTQLHLLLHNSAVGLSPLKAPSKGLFVLTDARCSTAVPPTETMHVDVELHQAGVLITDDAHVAQLDNTSSLRNPPESTVVDTRVLNTFWKRGYSSVGSIMSAVINTRIHQKDERGQSAVEVDVRNDFFLLETCADSTQTLSSILGGLAPPTPPSKESKYLTEPMTIDDMISSFSGDAYAKPERAMETLFDVDEEPKDTGGSPDDLILDDDMGSSIYGPISGMIGDLDDDQNNRDQSYGDTVESLLDDDPFEMTNSPDDMPFSDTALLRDLKQQALPAKSSEAVDLGNYEIEDLGFDALGVDEQALGSRHRFNAPTSRRTKSGRDASTAKLPFKLRLRDVNATWHMHDGYDWQKTRDGITAAVEVVEQRAEERLARRLQARVEPDEEESTIGDCMFNSVYITIPSNFTETPDIRRGINRQIDDLASESESVPASGMSRPTNYSASGRPIRQTHRRRLKLERSRYHKISFELKGMSVDLDVFSPGSSELQSAVDVRLRQFEIFDNVPTSTWKKFLTQQQTGGTQELSRPMVHIELLNRKTIQEREATDLMIHVAVQPLRLHVDQDALDFITRFTEFKDSSAGPPSPSDQPFLSRVEIDTVDLQLDYKPKKVDYVGLRSGLATEFMNFVILDQANIQLRHAIVYGIRGFEPLHKTLNDVWMPDVKRNQLPTILAGLAPVRSLVNIGTGVRDVVAIPIREYKKDGRIVRSVQKGAFHFGRTTASELARLGAKVAIGTQNLLSGAEGLLAPPNQRATHSSDRPGSSDPNDEDREPRAFSAYADQPLGVLSGLRSARRYLEHDLLTARDALIAVQGEVLESSNPGSAAMAVARHAPTVMLRPVIGASRAVGTALLGVGNQIDRGGVKRMEDVSIYFSCVLIAYMFDTNFFAEIQATLRTGRNKCGVWMDAIGMFQIGRFSEHIWSGQATDGGQDIGGEWRVYVGTLVFGAKRMNQIVR
jgi:autophagy-related protein 2